MELYTINTICEAFDILYKGADGYKTKTKSNGELDFTMLKSNATKEEIQFDLSKNTASHIQLYLNYFEKYPIRVIDIDDETISNEEIHQKVKEWLGVLPPYTLSSSKGKPHYYVYVDDYPSSFRDCDSIKCWKNFEGDFIQRLIVEKNNTQFYLGDIVETEEGLELPSINWKILENNMKVEKLNDLSKEKVEKPKLKKVKVLNTTEKTQETKQLNTKTKIAIEYLNLVNPSRFDDFQEWTILMFICHNLEIPYEIFDNISSKASGYNPTNNFSIWNSHIPDDKNGLVGLTRIKEWAKEDNLEQFNILEIKYNIINLLKENKSQENLAQLYITYHKDNIYYNPNNKKFYIFETKTNTWNNEITDETICNMISIFYKNLIEPHYNIIKIKVEKQKKIVEDAKVAVKECAKSNLEQAKEILESEKVILKELKEDVNFIKLLIETPTGSFAKVNNILDFIKGKVCMDATFFDKFNGNPYLFAFSNGLTLDLKIKKVRPIVKEDYIVLTTGYDYKPSTDENIKKAYDFVNNYFENDEMTKSLISALSCALLGYNKNEKFFVFTGVGANGKSTLDSVARMVFGNYYFALPVTQLTQVDRGQSSANTNLMSLQLKRFSMSQEPEDDTNSKDTSLSLKIGIIKQLTGNDPITTRANFDKKTTTYKPQFTQYLSANNVPKLSKSDGGIYRRLRVIEFTLQFTAEPGTDLTEENVRYKNVNIKEQINTEEFKYAFLHLLKKSWFDTDGIFYEASDIKKSTDEYMLEQNPIRNWFNENYEITELVISSFTDIYNHYLENNKTMKQKEFSGYLKQLVKTGIVKGLTKYRCIKKENDTKGDTKEECQIEPEL